MITRTAVKRGFTLVELTLVMAFMSMLLLAILILTIHAGKLYTKGLTNKTMNQISRDVADLMKRDFLAADASLVKLPGEVGTGDLKSGRICTGTVSYIWNTASLLSSTSPKVTADGKPITFRRVLDPTASLCAPDTSGLYPTVIPATLTSTELLGSDNRDYAIYTLTVTPVASDSTGKGLYGVSMVLGTNEKDTTQKDATSGFQCRPPVDNSANFDYCTVEELYTILRVGGKN
jgi:hypothetical protein